MWEQRQRKRKREREIDRERVGEGGKAEKQDREGGRDKERGKERESGRLYNIKKIREPLSHYFLLSCYLWFKLACNDTPLK